MAVDQVMHEELKIVGPEDSIRHIATLFDQRDTHHVLVMESNVLLGIISDRDLLKSIHPNSFSDIASHSEEVMLNKTANQIMSPKPITIPVTRSIIGAAELMLGKGFSALPVVDDNKRVLGIVSLRSITQYFVSRTRERKRKPQ